MRSLRTLLLSLVLTSTSYSATLPAGSLGGLLGGSSGTNASSVQNILVSFGLTYLMSDPKYAATLSALGINNAADLQNFISGDQSGANFNDIIVHAAFQYGISNPKYAAWFTQIGVTDEPSLRAFLKGKGSSSKDLIFSLALEYAKKNPKYAGWLDSLEITNISDIQDIFSGGLQGTNIRDLVLSMGLNYLQSNQSGNSKGQQYAIILTLLLGDNTLSSFDPSSLFLGAYDGLHLSEIKTIQKSKNKKVKAKT